MNKPNHICKICGKEYYFCQGCQVNHKLDWKKVGCCEEHANEYFGLVRISRGEFEPQAETSNKNNVDDAESSISDTPIKRGRKPKVVESNTETEE
jgi:hypothetical protein